jgi:hypothetical protein
VSRAPGRCCSRQRTEASATRMVAPSGALSRTIQAVRDIRRELLSQCSGSNPVLPSKRGCCRLRHSSGRPGARRLSICSGPTLPNRAGTRGVGPWQRSTLGKPEDSSARRVRRRYSRLVQPDHRHCSRTSMLVTYAGPQNTFEGSRPGEHRAFAPPPSRQGRLNIQLTVYGNRSALSIVVEYCPEGDAV